MTIEQTLTAARLSDSPVERVSLMSMALASIERDADVLPSDWRTEISNATKARVPRQARRESSSRRRAAA